MAQHGGIAAPHAAPDRAGRPGIACRLTVGWHESGRPANLAEHIERYGPPPRPAGRSAASLIDVITDSGLTGRGGAGFPTGVKMRAVASRRGPAVVVANGMESEPASEKDVALLSRAPHLVLDGAVLAASAIGANVVHLCLPRKDGQLIAAMVRAAAERDQAGLDPIPIQVHDLPHYYVSSEESALVSWLNGGLAKPAAVPPRPYQKGVGQRPTLVDNVETLAHIALIARFGSAWYRRAGVLDAPGTMLCTVAGAVAAPGVYEIELGSPVGDVLAMSGVDPAADTVLIGGYFGTWHALRDVGGLPLSVAGLRPAGASPGAGVLFALPAGSCGLSETARVLDWLADQGAGQCGPCMFGLPAIADDFAQLAVSQPSGQLLDRLRRRLGIVHGRGACHHPDGAVRMAGSALATFGTDVMAHASGRECAAAPSGQRRTPVLPLPRRLAEGGWQ